MNFSQGTLVVQHLSGTNLDGHASSYLLAVENFERVARTVFSELGSGASPPDTSLVSDAPATATTGRILFFCLSQLIVASKDE